MNRKPSPKAIKTETMERTIPANVLPIEYSRKLKFSSSDDHVPDTISLYNPPDTVARVVPTIICRLRPKKQNSM